MPKPKKIAGATRPEFAAHIPSSQSSSTKTKTKTQRQFLLLFGLLLGLMGLVLAGVYVRLNPREPTEAELKAPAIFGGLSGCKAMPKFVRTQGFGNTALLDTSETVLRGPGAVVYEPPPAGSKVPARRYKHPTWDVAGYLGPIARDADGNVFVIPVPRISNWENPLANQNKVYRIDSVTAEMKLLLDLPVTLSPTLANPYGALSLSFDCESKSLYVAGISGSGRETERGRIYRIDVSSSAPTVTSILDGVDAFGLVPFNGTKTKRLYFASARSGDVRSIALAPSGDFVGLPRQEFSVAGRYGDGDDRIRRMDIAANNNDMQLRGIEFSYNLVPATEKTETLYTFRYDREGDRWAFVEAVSVDKAPK